MNVFRTLSDSTNPNKDAERAEIAAHTTEYLRNGGRIYQAKYGETGTVIDSKAQARQNGQIAGTLAAAAARTPLQERRSRIVMESM